MTDSGPYKGVRDFYPEDERVQKYMFNTMRKVVESFGYEEYNASVLEPTELYTAKTSEEIINEQTYTFKDRGDRSVTLRPEMTPTVARMVAARRRELGYPLRWYSIQNFFRYERPQKGRLREFWQLNADIFGTSDLEADVEIGTIAYRIMKGLGAPDESFVIQVGSRRVLDAATRAAGMDDVTAKKYRVLADRKKKMDPEEFDKARKELGDTDPQAIITDRSDATVAAAVEELERYLSLLKARNVMNAVYDPSIVRGLDYYTGIVIEIFDTSPENPRALAGGGRYDNLIGHYSSESLPAVGFAMGDFVLHDFIETHKLLPDLAPATELYLAPVTTDDDEGAARVADQLRAKGVKVALGMRHEKVGDHIKAAGKLGIPQFAAYGGDEARSGKLKVKSLKTGEETELIL